VPRLEPEVVSSYFASSSSTGCSHTTASAAVPRNQSSVQSSSKISDQTDSRQTDEVMLQDAGGNSIDCQVCGKTLSHLNEQRRLQHVNRCLDQVCMSANCPVMMACYVFAVLLFKCSVQVCMVSLWLLLLFCCLSFIYLFILFIWLLIYFIMHKGSQINRTKTETAVFCYLKALSSSQCFGPKTARCLRVVIFLAHIMSIVFYFCTMMLLEVPP